MRLLMTLAADAGCDVDGYDDDDATYLTGNLAAVSLTEPLNISPTTQGLDQAVILTIICGLSGTVNNHGNGLPSKRGNNNFSAGRTNLGVENEDVEPRC